MKNSVDVLTYADTLEIEDLQNAIMKFIADNDDAVFASNEWKLLTENNLKLAMKVMQLCYKIVKERSDELTKRNDSYKRKVFVHTSLKNDYSSDDD
jgi:hypothetical protein